MNWSSKTIAPKIGNAPFRILLIDAYSASHVGNAALVDSSINLIRRYFPCSEIKLLAHHPESIRDLTGCKTANYLFWDLLKPKDSIGRLLWILTNLPWLLINTTNFVLLKPLRLDLNPLCYTFSRKKRRAIEFFLESDIVISISGEQINENFWKHLPFLLYGYWFARKLGKSVVIFPQSIGPLTKPILKSITCFVLNKCDLVFPRDSFSFDILEDIGAKESITHLIPDVAITQPYIDSSQAGSILRGAGVDISEHPLLGVVMSEWIGKEIGDVGCRDYIDVVVKFCNFFVGKLSGQIVLFTANMPMYDGSLDDFSVSKEIYKRIGNREKVILLSKLYSPREFKGMFGEMDLVLSSRMHASILSTMIGTPTITINTQRKLYGYMSLIGQESLSIDIKELGFELLKEKAVNCLNDRDKISKSLKEQRVSKIRVIEKIGELIGEIIGKQE